MELGSANAPILLVNKPAAPHRRPPRPPGTTTLAMKVALGIGAAVFFFGTFVWLMLGLWAFTVIALLVGAAEILVHTGGLEPETFATSATVAMIGASALLLAIPAAWAVRAVRGGRTGSSRFLRRPVLSTSASLLVALAAVSVIGWRPSPYFPYPLATVVVIACVFYFAVVLVVASGQLALLAWRNLTSWASRTPYRVGFVTATMFLLGTAGFVTQSRVQLVDRGEDAVAWLAPEPAPEVDGVVDAEMDVLCIAAARTSPQLALSGAAPGCDLTPGGGAGAGDDCFTSLMNDNVPAARNDLRRAFGISDFDADDATILAVIATCTREPPPIDPSGYFWTAAHNEALRAVTAARRLVWCDGTEDDLPSCSMATFDEERDVMLVDLWNRAMCTLERREAVVVRRRLVDDESFKEIARRLKVTEAKAKDTFHNAIKKLRRLKIADCIRE